MRRFNKDKYFHKLQNKNNKKTKIISIVISVVVLIGAIIFFSFARFESTQTFSLIDGVGYIAPKAILTNGKNFNIVLKTLAGNENPTSDTYDDTITSLEWSDTPPLDSDNAVDVADSSSNSPIYVWFKDGTIYINSELDKIYMQWWSSYMFNQMQGITSLDLSHFDTSNVTDMADMFYGMSSLTSLNLSSFDTSKVKSMNNMFYGMNKLTNLDLSHFDTSNVTSMGFMFGGMKSLTSLDVSHFDTSKVTRMGCMFCRMDNLTNLDLSNFDTASVTDMSNMFFEMDNITTIYVGTGWSTASVTSGGSMFSSDSKLVGGSGTTYDSNHLDYTYAHVDGGTSNPGYFTLKTN